MRVTKTIKEYLEKQIKNKAHSSPKYEALKAASKADEEAFDAAVKAIKEHAEAEVEKLIEQYECSSRYSYSRDSRVEIRTGDLETPTGKVFHDYIREINNQIDEKVDEIIIALELGGTKEMLEDLLQEVSFD